MPGVRARRRRRRPRRPPRHPRRLRSPPGRSSTSPMKPAARSSSSTRRRRRWSSGLPSASGRAASACRATARSCSSRCRDRRLPALASTSRSCRRRTALPMGSASSIWRRTSSCRNLHERSGSGGVRPSRPTARRCTCRTKSRPRCPSSMWRAARFGRVSRSARNPKASPCGPTAARSTSPARATTKCLARSTRRSLKVVGRMKTAARPRAIAFTKDIKTAFVTDETAATVSVIDTAKRAVIAPIVIPKGARPDGAAADGRSALARRVAGVRLARPRQGHCRDRRRRRALSPEPSRTSAIVLGGSRSAPTERRSTRRTVRRPMCRSSTSPPASVERRDRDWRQPLGAGAQVGVEYAHGARAYMPPSTQIVWPVTNSDSGPTMYRTARPMSEG